MFIFDGRLNRVHNADIRVVILELTCHDSFFITSQDNPLPEHMTLVSLASYRPCGCRSHQKGICFYPDWPNREEDDVLYSKAPDEDTLILSHG
jgi:hypothetical protein